MCLAPHPSHTSTTNGTAKAAYYLLHTSCQMQLSLMTMASSMFQLTVIVLCLLRASISYNSECTRPDSCSHDDVNPPKDYNYSECEVEKDLDCGKSLYYKNSTSCCCNCPDGTFMDKRNTCNYCRPHTECGPNEEIESSGTATKDTKCRCRSFPIPWEDCEKINCTVFPPDMTTGSLVIFINNTQQPDNNTMQSDNSTTKPCHEGDITVCF